MVTGNLQRTRGLLKTDKAAGEMKGVIIEVNKEQSAASRRLLDCPKMGTALTARVAWGLTRHLGLQ